MKPALQFGFAAFLVFVLHLLQWPLIHGAAGVSEGVSVFLAMTFGLTQLLYVGPLLWVLRRNDELPMLYGALTAAVLTVLLNLGLFGLGSGLEAPEPVESQIPHMSH